MVSETLSFLSDEINGFIANKDFRYRGKTVAIVSDLVDAKGDPAYLKLLQGQADGLIITLINVEEETVGKSQAAIYKKPDGSIEPLNPDIKLNVYIMITGVSNMSDQQRYLNSLKVLSYAIGFFQNKNVFDRINSATLPDGVEKLIAEMVSLTFEQQNHIWGALGAKYQPSVMFKIRMLIYREIINRDSDLRIRTIDTELASN
jgi:Pvc16 N-terminal domain